MAQDLVVKSDWKAVPLKDLVRSQLEHFSELIGSRISIDGPDCRLTVGATQAVGMALHELATNAAKYGALSNETGCIELIWEIKFQAGAPAAFMMRWIEAGGPPVTQPSRQGFGLSIVVEMVEASIHGAEVELQFLPKGVSWRLTCAANNLLEDDEPVVQQTQAMRRPLRPPQQPRDRRILVVEDDALLARHLARNLSDAGFEVIGPASTVERALTLIEEQGCDAAVLDFSLQNETSEPVADALTTSGTPFVAVTGYSDAQLPELFRTASLLTKPVRQSDLIERLTRLLGTDG